MEEGRKLARRALNDWGLAADAETAALVMSELAANAVRHARGPKINMTVHRPQTGLVSVSVIDRSPEAPPQPGTPGTDAESGRGLLLVAAVSLRWGWEHMGTGKQPWGKRVWAELEVTTRDAGPPTVGQ
ncbi:ATP-binding protein [Streptomyces tailanensis]|uniref:ATP-binding protein n=1 Tax=Streptomyces tailanensis TaxID=2569858 RepID=UPI00155ADC12|nr:ATP-binding protein [Streptomyces tailanensis]